MAIPNAAAMLQPTLPNLIGVLVGITFLRSIAPLSALYTTYFVLQYCLYRRYTTWRPLIALQAWCFAETVFLLFFLAYRVYLQAEAVHPPLRSKEDRRKLFDKVQNEVNDTERFMQGWFRGAKVEDIGRKEVRNFLNWSFWEGRASAEDAEELEEYVDRSEKMAGVKLKEDGPAKSLRLTIDPVEMDYRSLLWYTIIMLLDTVGAIALWSQGYLYYRTSWSSPWVYPPRLTAFFTSRESPASHLSYWYRTHTSKTRLPVIFLHGVGIGLQAYVEFLGLLEKALNADRAADDQVGIMAIEFMPISSRLTHPVPRRADFIQQVTRILDKHGLKQVVLVNHSYGSIASSHILTDDVLSSRISAVLSIDPVTILLHLPDVAYNFTIRKPRRANEWQLWYFASKDPGIAHTLGRHLFWYESVLWRDRIVELVGRGMKFTASLSRHDLIVDTPAVGKYLMANDKPDPVIANGEMHLESSSMTSDEWKERDWTGHGLEVLWWEDFDHAQVMDDVVSRQKLIDVIAAYCLNDKKAQ